MGVTRIYQEIPSPVAPNRFFKALIIDSSTLLPKLLPQTIKSIVTLRGDGGAGTIEQVNFTESSHFKYVKHRIEEVDVENYVCKYTLIEGDALGDKLRFIAYDMKFEASVSGGCVCKIVSEYHTMEGQEDIKEEEIKEGKESAMGIYKVIESYLLDNPSACA